MSNVPNKTDSLAYTVRYWIGRALAGSIDVRRPLWIDKFEFVRFSGRGFDAASTSSASQWMRDCFSFTSAIVTSAMEAQQKQNQKKALGQRLYNVPPQKEFGAT